MGSVEAGCCAKGFGVGEQFELSRFEFEPGVGEQGGDDLGDRPGFLRFWKGR
jgi:hypothetical protein